MTEIDRIPLAHSVRYVARGLPEVPNQYGRGTLAPSEITLTYRAAEDSLLGRVHAYIEGRLWVDGVEIPLTSGGLFGQHYDAGFDGWPEWLAEEARLHDPDAADVSPPAVDRTNLRNRIAAAIHRYDNQHGLSGNDMPGKHQRGEADAVLAVLLGPIPAGTDTATWTAIRAIQLMNEAGRERDAARAAPLSAAERQFLTFALELAADEMASRGDEFDDEDDAALTTLRRMADETPQPETHRCGNCDGIDPSTCLTNPDRADEAQQPKTPTLDSASCDAEPPPTLVNADGQEWQTGDCWCTRPPGHDGEHRCQPCSDRHGAPGWTDGAQQDGAAS